LEFELILIDDVCKSYGSHKALRGISFNVRQGGVVGFLGSNGAGKSTLMRIMTGYLKADSGNVAVCGIDVGKSPLEVQQKIGYLPEGNPLYTDMRVNEFLAFRAKVKGVSRSSLRSRVDFAVDSCRLGDVRNRIIGHLSKGFRQRVGLADALVGESELLILDEPMVGLDPNQLRDIRQLIEHLGKEKTVFLSTHVLHDVERLCREVIIIDKGRLLAIDSPERLCAPEDGSGRIGVVAEWADNMEASLAEAEGVEKVDGKGITEGTETFEIDCTDIDKAREGIIFLFRKNDWNLLELKTLPVRLEDIFSKVTASANEVGVDKGKSGGER
jgi:ABC-2 type transport system ATP-binding protein